MYHPARLGWRRGGHLCRVADNTVWSHWQMASRNSEVNFTKNYTLLYLLPCDLSNGFISSDLEWPLKVISVLLLLVCTDYARSVSDSYVSCSRNISTSGQKRDASVAFCSICSFCWHANTPCVHKKRADYPDASLSPSKIRTRFLPAS